MPLPSGEHPPPGYCGVGALFRVGAGRRLLKQLPQAGHPKREGEVGNPAASQPPSYPHRSDQPEAVLAGGCPAHPTPCIANQGEDRSSLSQSEHEGLGLMPSRGARQFGFPSGPFLGGAEASVTQSKKGEPCC